MILVRGLALGSALAASGIAAGELGWLTLGACMLVGGKGRGQTR